VLTGAVPTRLIARRKSAANFSSETGSGGGILKATRGRVAITVLPVGIRLPPYAIQTIDSFVFS